MARRRKPDPRPHWLTLVGLACVVLFVLTVAITNAFGWPALIPGPLGIAAAVLAIAAAGFAFSLWEHVRLFARERRWPNLAGALLLFVGALVIDAIGVHSGIETLAEPWRAQFERQADANQAAAQRALDQRREDLGLEIAEIRARINTVPIDLSGGPQNDAEARLAWSEITAADRALIDRKQLALERMPRTVDQEPVAPWLSPAIWAFALFAELVVAFGISILGIEIAPRFAHKEEERGEVPAPPVVSVVTPLRPRRRALAQADGSRWSGWED
jgi:hypothetical protein